MAHTVRSRKVWIQGIDHQCLKESAVSNVKSNNEPGAPLVAPGPLLDCGRASEVTKGVPFFLLFELAFPPFDRQLFL